MFGMINKIRAQAGMRDRLLDIQVEGSGAMPGCLSYVIARDPADADVIWVTEVMARRGEPQGVAVAAPGAGRDRQGTAADRRLRVERGDGTGRWCGNFRCKAMRSATGAPNAAVSESR